MEQQSQQANNIPRLRPDLQFNLVKDKGEKIYTLHDPYNDRYFQFKEYEYIISSLLDGVNTSKEIIPIFEKQFDAILPEETLQAFVVKLDAMGLLVGSAIPPKVDKYSGLLFKKFKLFNPDGIFDFLIKYVGFLFRPLSVKIFFVIILFAGYLLLKRWPEFFSYGMPSFGNSEWLGVFVGAMLIIAIISTHEFAHGLSLKYFGGKVPEIGFMFMIFLPACYCDVSDAWRLPKNKKLFVTFAGGFYEILVGSFAMIVWSFAEPHLWLSDLAYLIVMGSVFTIGFNFNPLIRLDGYYILSDFLEIPNLRTESVQYLGSIFSSKKNPLTARKYTLREKFIFFFYGILSTLFIVFMIGVIYSLLANWLIDNLRLTGVLISIFIFLFLLYVFFLKGIIVGALKRMKA
ncbi:MAG: hypothetical protein AB7V50_04560 [Vampirovibrionia bacterium]